MAVISVGAHVDTFEVETGAYQLSTTAGRFDSDAADGAMQIESGVNQIKNTFLSAIGASSEHWIHFECYQTLIDGALATGFIELFSGDPASANPAYRINLAATTGIPTAQRYTGAAYSNIGTGAGSASMVDAATLVAIDIQIVDNATTGVFRIYKDGVLVLDQNNVDTTHDQTDFDTIVFRGMNSTTSFISQLIVADENTTGWKLFTSIPIGESGVTPANTDWTGGGGANGYDLLNDFAYVNTDFIESNVGAEKETFDMENIAAAFSAFNVKAVAAAARASVDSGATVDTFRFLLDDDSTQEVSPDVSITKDGSENARFYIWDEDPFATAAWSQTVFNSLDIGVEARDTV